MAEFRAFRGIRYNFDAIGHDWSNVLAPPYDVLSGDDKAALLRKDARNIVAVDLPFVPPKSAGPPAVYAEANNVLQQWIADGVLLQESEPAVYVYEETFAVEGKTLTRRMVLAAMRLEEFGAGTVFPHELTHGGPKEDRLALMKATRCQLSPIFGLFPDPSHAVAAALGRAGQAPDATGTMDGIEHRLWIERDPTTIEHAMMLLAGSHVYIADGHHRYSTALNYRNAVAEAAGGSLPADHPANFVLVCLCAMEDPGCVILPTHRILSGLASLKPNDVLRVWQPACSFAAVASPQKCLDALLAHTNEYDIVVYVADEDAYYTGTFTKRDALTTLSPDNSDAWRALDLAYLHRYMIDELLTGAIEADKPKIDYSPSAEKTIEMAKQARGAAVFVKPTTMDELRAVAQAGDFMPQKSTYFYPKIATGLVIHPLA